MDSFLIFGVLKISIKVYFLFLLLSFSSFAFSSSNVCEIEGQKMSVSLLDIVVEYIHRNPTTTTTTK